MKMKPTVNTQRRLNEVNGKPVSAELTAAMQLAQKPIFAMPNCNKQAMAWVNEIRGDTP